ncbi:MAG TPA: S9 family peptidase [Thermoanaerobaculia bacterium]|nr:S9 family peptidase [Thermoanaerobaculia bacterium]
MIPFRSTAGRRPAAPAAPLAALAALALTAALAAPHPAAAAESPFESEVMTPYDVARLESVGRVEVSPDGRHVAYVLSVPREPWGDESGPAWGELHVVSTADGVSRPFVTGEINVGDLAWTPDGSALAFLARRGEDEERALWAIPFGGGEARRVLEHDTGVDAFSFSPDGRRVAFLSQAPESEEREELEEKGFDAIVYEERLRSTELWIAEVDLAAATAGDARKIELVGSASNLHWSPAGDRIALALAPTPLIDDSYMAQRVKVVDVASGRIVGEVANPGKLGAIAWSPDGSHLALVAGVDVHDPAPGRLMVVPATGGTPRDVLPGLLGHVDDVAWRDAERIVYLASRGVRTFVGEVGRDGSGDRVLVPEGETIWSQISLADDGAGLALAADSAEHPSEVYWLAGPQAGVAGGPRRLTDHNPWLADKRLAPQEVVTFRARDGLELEGILIRPLDERRGQRYPLILTVHGGPEAHHTDGWQTGYSSPGQVGAARGFAVFYTNYRGSTGRGVEFSKLSQGDPAGKEFDDLIDAVDHLVGTGLVDRDRVGVTGGSYGGYATGWLSTRYTDRIAAGVMFVGISNLFSKVGTSDIPQELYLVHMRHWPWDDWDLMLERSPIRYVEQARTPLLILHGAEDPRVHPGQSLQLYRYLEILDRVPVRLVLYPGEGHGNRRAAARLDYNLRMMRWFEHYLAPGDRRAAEPPPPDVDYAIPPEWGGEVPGEDEAPAVEDETDEDDEEDEEDEDGEAGEAREAA